MCAGAVVASSGDVHGPGAVFADLNNDGFEDLYLVRGGAANELYLNTDDAGQRVFVRAVGDAGAGDTGPATGAIAGDYDNDGDLDLFVTNYAAPNLLLQNRLMETGALYFVDVTAHTDPTPGVVDDQFGLGTAEWDASQLKALSADEGVTGTLKVGAQQPPALPALSSPSNVLPQRQDRKASRVEAEPGKDEVEQDLEAYMDSVDQVFAELF